MITVEQIRNLPVGGGRRYEIHQGPTAASTQIFNATDSLDDALKMVDMYRGFAGNGANKPPLCRRSYWKVVDKETKQTLKTWNHDSI